MAVRSAKKSPTKAQEKMKRKSRDEEEEIEEEQEEETEEEEQEEEEEEEEEEERPRKKAVKKAAKKTSKRRDEEEEEEADAEDSEIPSFSGKKLKSLRLAEDFLETEGVYGFKVKSAKYMPPKEEMPGFVAVELKVLEAPDEAEEPDNGWPTVKPRFAVQIGKKKDEKAKQRVQIGTREFAQFAFACLGELAEDDERDVKELCAELKGAEVNAQVVHSQDGYQNLRRWAATE